MDDQDQVYGEEQQVEEYEPVGNEPIEDVCEQVDDGTVIAEDDVAMNEQASAVDDEISEQSSDTTLVSSDGGSDDSMDKPVEQDEPYRTVKEFNEQPGESMGGGVPSAGMGGHDQQLQPYDTVEEVGEQPRSGGLMVPPNEGGPVTTTEYEAAEATSSSSGGNGNSAPPNVSVNVDNSPGAYVPVSVHTENTNITSAGGGGY